MFFYAAGAGDDPGIYGWAVIDRYDEENGTIYFIPTAPTNHLKMDPWWDDAVKKLTDDIRGPMKQATLFPVAKDLLPKIRKGVRTWTRPDE